MKQVILTAVILSTVATGLSAHSLSKQNLVQRSLTLKDGEILLGGALAYGKTGKADDVIWGAQAAYGINDNLTLSLDGLRYRLLARSNDNQGLELTLGAGLKGFMQQQNKNVLGYGADVTGKYVLSPDLALTFGAEYIFWNTRNASNAKEFRFSIGGQYQLIDDVTVSVDYSFRDLHDFVQDNTYTVSAGINYALNQQIDIGLGFSYSSFDGHKNAFDIDSAHKRYAGIHASYRF